MNFDDLVNFLRGNWAAIAATIVIVSPVLWAILNYFFKHRIESLRTQNEMLKQKIDLLEKNKEAARISGAPHHEGVIDMIGEWTRMVYEIRSRYRSAMNNGEPWPGASRQLVERENDLYTRILG